MKMLGWKALLVASALLLPAAANAQRSGDAAKAAAPSKEDIAKGRAAVPGLIQAAGARCAVGDAAFRGTGTSAKKKVDIYETACTDGPGYLLIKTEGVDKPAAYPCLAVADQGTKCILPANADQKPGLTKLAQAAGRTCAVSNARYIGTSAASGETFYELACASAGGFRLGVPAVASSPPEVNDCLSVLGTSSACTLTTKEQALAGLQPLLKASGRACQVSDGRYIGASTTTKQTYYEVACGSAPGFVLAADTATGGFKTAMSCSAAVGLDGGCKLTSATQVAAEDDARYTRLATDAGFPCQVNRTRPVGMSGDREVVELACSNRADGAFGMFPTSGAGAPQIIDCIKATGTLQQACTLTQPSALYARYSAALVAKGRGSCQVSGARYIGVTGAGGDVIETACSDGKPGWVIYFAKGQDTQVSQLLSCGQSSNDGRPCKLPTNLAGNTPAGRG